MMGHNGGNQSRLFYSFNLDDHVPANHLLRGVNQFLDLSDLRAYLAPFYSQLRLRPGATDVQRRPRFSPTVRFSSQEVCTAALRPSDRRAIVLQSERPHRSHRLSCTSSAAVYPACQRRVARRSWSHGRRL